MWIFLATVSSAFGQDVDVDDLIYMTEDYRPNNYWENGELKGISIELLKLMWAKMGYPEQSIQLLPWARGYYYLIREKNHVLFATSRTEERENLFKWVGPLYSVKIILIALSESSININSIEDAKKYMIGTIRDDVSEQLLVACGFEKEKLQRVNTIEQNLMKLKFGRIDLISFSEKGLNDYLKAGQFNSNEFRTVFAFNGNKSYYAFNKSVPDALIRRFQKALDSLSREHQAILDKYHNK